jgi:large conductance mechanosensitive channel
MLNAIDKMRTIIYNIVIKQKKEIAMKKFFGEFKKFITRGNVVDMAVGVIVGSSFTAIVNAMSNNILKPIINWVLAIAFGKESMSEVFTFLLRVDKQVETTLENGDVITEIVPDLTQSIYIDWGAFINAVINFILIAFVLFCIVKLVNKLRENGEKMKKAKPTKEEKKEMKALGIKRTDRKAVAAYYADKAAKAALADEEAKKAAAEKARLDREANPTTEDLLKKILTVLESK